MSDSSMSASELRRRYHRGGTAEDSSLSASALRARYDIPSNTFGKAPAGSNSNALPLAVIAIAAAILLAAIAFR